MHCTIRPYTPDDRTRCLDIFRSNCPPYFDPAEEVLFTRCLDRLDLDQIIHPQAEASQFFVLVHQEIILACGGYYIVRGQPVAAMAWGMVDHAFHRQGFGSTLLQFRIDHLRSYYPTHQLRLDTSQHTYPFFERFGFRVTKVTTDGYGSGLDQVDMVI